MAFIIEAFFSGCISKVINDGKDYSWSKIKSVIKDRHDQNISTKIYRLIESVLNIVTDNTYKNSDDLYDAIEKICIEFKNHGDTLESVKSGLNVLGADASNQRCENFLERFHEGVCRDDDLYKVVIWDLEQKGININQEEFQKLNEKINKNHVELVEKLDSIRESSIEEKIDAVELKFQNNKKQDYINLWNSRLFLHLDNDERPITLADAFIMPDFEMYNRNSHINYNSSDNFDVIIDKFIKYDQTTVILVVGEPGMGKSSVLSWIANKYKEDERFIFLRFRDWERDELSKGLLRGICNTLGLNRVGELDNKILILDGFDEMKLLGSKEKLLNHFLNLINDMDRFKCIITSRPAYINMNQFKTSIKLLPFNPNKIDLFCQIVNKIVINKDELIEKNVSVLGIPVILYMAIMSDIEFTKNKTKPELYNRIFAEEGGIFDKFCYKGKGYDKGANLLRDRENVELYLKFLRNVAFSMFQKNSLVIQRNECVIPPLEFEGSSICILEFPIKHFFENTENNIEFIHKSIYEYFVSEYIFKVLYNEINDTFEVEHCAGVLGDILKSNNLSLEIIEFLKFRIRENKGLNQKLELINKTFHIMLQHGMTYHMEERCINVIDCEMKIFANMLEIIHIWDFSNLILDISASSYLKYSSNEIQLNLQGMYLNNKMLRGLDFKKINLQYSKIENAIIENDNLEGKNLRGIIWKKASLVGTNLKNADLENADLENADLSEAKLCNAKLINSRLIRADLLGADLSGADLQNAKLNEASLYGAILLNVNLDGANLDECNINYSIWTDNYLFKILPELIHTVFKYIIIENNKGDRKTIERRDLFVIK